MCREHRALVLRILSRRTDVQEASARDIAQNVLVALWEYVRDHQKTPDRVRGFVLDLVAKQLSDRGRRRARKASVAREADVEDGLVEGGPGPEEAVDERRKLEKLKRALARLPRHEAKAIRRVDVLEQTIDEAAQALGRPLSTVARHRTQGLARLGDLANQPEGAPPAGKLRSA